MGCYPNQPAFSYNDAQFRSQFPAFANTTTYPQTTLQQYFTTAGLYIANTNYGFLAQAGASLTGLYLLTAHLAQLATLIASGQTPSIVSASGIDKISVTLEPPPLQNQYQWWLSTTPYGAQLLALLQAQSVGGFYQPGGLGRAGFNYNTAPYWNC